MGMETEMGVEMAEMVREMELAMDRDGDGVGVCVIDLMIEV